VGVTNVGTKDDFPKQSAVAPTRCSEEECQFHGLEAATVKAGLKGWLKASFLVCSCAQNVPLKMNLWIFARKIRFQQ